MRGMKQIELATLSGISKYSISHYLKGDWEGKQDAVYELARVLDVSEAWLMGYAVPPERKTVAKGAPAIPPGFIPLPKMKKVPLIGAIACGDPITALQNREGEVDAPEDMRCDFALKCHGDSMTGAGIHDGGHRVHPHPARSGERRDRCGTNRRGSYTETGLPPHGLYRAAARELGL